MESTKNKLTFNQYEFFLKLKNYLNTPIYFYGSIQRDDYFPGKSDLDVDIFTENEKYTIYALCNFLNLHKSDFKKSVYKVDNKIITGYKVKYEDEEKNIQVEIALYNEKFKELVLNDHLKDFNLPFHILFFLFIIKFLYYNLQILPKEYYKNLKRIIMNDGAEVKFVVLD